MNKTYNINLSGALFIINDDAYNLLDNYLKTLQNAFLEQEDGIELISDIENRISEILSDLSENGRIVVDLKMVNSVINQMGRPEEIIEVNIQENSPIEEIKEEVITPPPYNEKTSKRLFRDPNCKIIGGVCSGLAEYLNIDVTIVRIAFVLLFFLTKSAMIVIYMILWICMPVAKTPLDQMRMRGENPSISNIGKRVQSAFERKSEAYQKAHNSGFFSEIGKIFVKIILFLFLLIPGAFFITCSVVLVLFLVCIIFYLFKIPALGLFAIPTENIICSFLCGIGILTTILIPSFLLCKLIILSILNKDDSLKISRNNKIGLLIIWIIGIILTFSTLTITLDTIEQTKIINHKIEFKEKNKIELPNILYNVD